MLSRRSNASPLSAPAVLDRARVGERLHAALAGLRELHVLREKQADMVRWALRAEPPRARAAAAEEEERRLEETLGALREQLSRLRRQDVGLKSHLQQLDQQISELKLDVCKASTEQLESDSRPSSGFYDLSDGGSGSLSNSCTSVYSECLSSSQSSLLPHHHLVGGHSEASRRRSADESAAQAEPPRGSGVRLGSSRIRAGSGIADRAKPRPVSTGDLDKVLISSKSMDVSKSSGCHSVHFCASNPKYQSDLVSRNSSEVYRYPSPLHAVALQSPLFSLTWEVATSLAEPSASQSRPSSSSDLLEGPSVCFENRSAEYISELLQRNLSKAGYQSETWRDRFQSTTTTLNKSPAEGSKVSTSVSSLAPKFWDKSSLLHPKNLRMDTEKTGRCGISSDSSLNRVEELSMFSQNSYPAGPSPGRDAETKGVAVLLDSPKWDKEGGGEQPSRESSCPGESLQATEPLASSTNKGQGSEMPLPGTSQLEFVHAQFVPAGSRQVKVRQADRKAKAVKVKRRSSEKLRPSCDRGRDAIGRVDRHADGSPKQSTAGRASGDPPKHPAEGGFRSCSESSVLASSLPSIPCFQAQGDPAPQSSKAQRAQPSRAERVPVDPGRKRQTVQKLQSAVETGAWPSSGVMSHGQRSKEVHRQEALRKGGLVRSASARPRSVQWGGHQRLFHPSASYYGGHASRYPRAPYPNYPPQSESEYSADGASLFHSTIAESSEGELSDFTANRFGDSESSQGSQSPSDSDSSLSLEEDEDGAGLVWAEAAVGPTAAGVPLQQPRPEPPACRIKASRALKKKIRRFQPAALKVMTMV
ncbi:dapper homolog 2 [Scleropages formosus]|uniref:Dishevelled-binding antagonist of beta-catenin 2 n=1 Tax=Scleropages formosus TaxID=113540 RepID=A0A8C9QU85_SCLFO|nr:dapper homolog 2 [Scleropages formosus]